MDALLEEATSLNDGCNDGCKKLCGLGADVEVEVEARIDIKENSWGGEGFLEIETMEGGRSKS